MGKVHVMGGREQERVGGGMTTKDIFLAGVATLVGIGLLILITATARELQDAERLQKIVDGKAAFMQEVKGEWRLHVDCGREEIVCKDEDRWGYEERTDGNYRNTATDRRGKGGADHPTVR